MIQGVGFWVIANDAVIDFEERRGLIRIERRTVFDKLQFVAGCRHKIPIDKLKFVGHQVLTPLRKTSMTTSAIGSSL